MTIEEVTAALEELDNQGKLEPLVMDALDMVQEDMQREVSDINQKCVKKILSRGGPFSDEEILFFIKNAGADNSGNSIDNMDSWNEDVADAYAEHLQNYLYNYKDSATEIDPSIDPTQQQIGIMAQDLKEVNPACVVPTEDGTLTVDTGKLALMNAGVIADLARRVNKLEGN